MAFLNADTVLSFSSIVIGWQSRICSTFDHHLVLCPTNCDNIMPGYDRNHDGSGGRYRIFSPLIFSEIVFWIGAIGSVVSADSLISVNEII